jgi:isoquinoline 1-oxidoreductase beta subunit
VGHVVEVSIKDNIPTVHKVWSAVHCGQVVNPDGAATQVEGAIVFGLSAAFNQQIELKDGNIQQGNFDDYEVLRMNQMPVVSVSFVESNEAPTGLGEPGVPPVAPAVANALFKLTNKRLRKLPFSKELKA